MNSRDNRITDNRYQVVQKYGFFQAECRQAATFIVFIGFHYCMDYVFCFQSVTLPTTHLFDRSFFDNLTDVPTMVCSHMSSSISQSVLLTVSLIFENYLMLQLRDHEDYIMISPRSRTHCHIQVEVPAFLNALFPSKWMDLPLTLRVIQSCTLIFNFWDS
jgi:hypothetical protein